MYTVILIFVSIVLLVFFAIQLLAMFALESDPEHDKMNWSELPKVSLLLAARNEENLIIRSLVSIAALNYPAEKLEVLIGDDNSNDNTNELVQNFIKGHPNFKLFKITKTKGKGRGKANVLAHLAHEANGEFYFITDVDVSLPANWIKDMINAFTPDVGILSGTTMCERGPTNFARLQSMDWLHFMGYIKSFANWGVACTSVGNNMAVRAKAYWETGGFEKIDFSITEDYKLFQAVTGSGWEWRTLLNADTLGKAYYIPSVKEMLHQRKRWLIGARDLPLNWKLLIILYGLFLPALLALWFVSPELAALTWMLKFLFQSLFIYQLSRKVDEKPFSMWMMMQYEAYVVLNTLATAIFYFLPFASKWKGRTYNKAYIE